LAEKMACIIQQSCRQNDIVARWGGDEFGIILPNTDKATANTIRDRIRAACNSLQGRGLLLSISMGVVTKTDEATSLSLVLKEAEDLMCQAKLIEGRKVREAITESLGKILQANDYEMEGHIERLQTLLLMRNALPCENMWKLVIALPKHPANLPILPILFYITMNGGMGRVIRRGLRERRFRCCHALLPL